MVLIEALSAVITTAKMGKMQLLGVIAVIVAFSSVHAKVYFREEFQDGGKFGSKYSDIICTSNFLFGVGLIFFIFLCFTCFKSYVRYIVADIKVPIARFIEKNAPIFSFLFGGP